MGMPPDGLFASKAAVVSGPLSKSYRAYGFISQRGKGGVYRVLDFTALPPKRCILKEGRRYGEIDLYVRTDIAEYRTRRK
jgi:hypothetical protein